MIGLKIRQYLKRVYFNVIMVSACAAVFPLIISRDVNENLLNFILLSMFCMLTASLSIFYIGCSHKERVFVFNKLKGLKDKVSRKL